MNAGLIFLLFVLAILVLVTLARSVFVIRQYERGVVSTFGKFVRVADPGLTLVFPYVQTLERVDMREMVADVSPQQVITSDNAAVTVDAVIYTEVTDPFRRVFNIASFFVAVIKLAQTNLRNVIGAMELDQVLTSREVINAQLRQILDDATDKWGARVTRVEIQTVEPPRDIVEAMTRQMKAERDKRARILEAEGIRQSAILEAEGAKQAAILEAEGERQARILRAQGDAEAIRQIADADKFREATVAQGEAQAIEFVFDAIHRGDPTHDLLAVRYLDTLARVADGQATKVFLPLEATGMLAGIAAIADVYREGAPPAGPTTSTPRTPPAPPPAGPPA